MQSFGSWLSPPKRSCVRVRASSLQLLQQLSFTTDSACGAEPRLQWAGLRDEEGEEGTQGDVTGDRISWRNVGMASRKEQISSAAAEIRCNNSA